MRLFFSIFAEAFSPSYKVKTPILIRIMSFVSFEFYSQTFNKFSIL